MSKRLQVLVSEEELRRLQQKAAGERVSLGEWVRRVLRRAVDEDSEKSVDLKVKAIRKAYEYEFPTGSIEEINQVIEESYGKGLP
jgi:hypothetical protein